MSVVFMKLPWTLLVRIESKVLYCVRYYHRCMVPSRSLRRSSRSASRAILRHRRKRFRSPFGVSGKKYATLLAGRYLSSLTLASSEKSLYPISKHRPPLKRLVPYRLCLLFPICSPSSIFLATDIQKSDSFMIVTCPPQYSG